MSHTSQRLHFCSLQHAETLMCLQYYGGFCKPNSAKKDRYLALPAFWIQPMICPDSTTVSSDQTIFSRGM